MYLISVPTCTHLISLHYLRITPIKFLLYVLEFIVIFFMTKFVITYLWPFFLVFSN